MSKYDKSEETDYGNALLVEGYMAKYIYVKPELRGVSGSAKKTIRVSKDVFIDLDDKGEIMGIEILGE